MIDCILHVPDFPTLVGHLDANHPEMLQRNEDGSLAMPPVVVGFARSPARETSPEVMVYARLTEQQDAQWRGMPGVTILAEAPFTGPGTAEAVYDQILGDADKRAIYERVYPHAPYDVTDPETGEVTTITPPLWFGMLAGG